MEPEPIDLLEVAGGAAMARYAAPAAGIGAVVLSSSWSSGVAGAAYRRSAHEPGPSPCRERGRSRHTSGTP